MPRGEPKNAKAADKIVLPFDNHREETEATHPFCVFALGAMLVVLDFEKALYELQVGKFIGSL
jgi:hypothetical protein